MELSIIIPCYRSSQNIEDLNDRINQAAIKITKKYEIIYINDCSPDDTLDKLRKIAATTKRVKVIDLMFNVGQFRALMCGFYHSTGSYIITLDDDLQHPPEEMSNLYYALKSRNEIDIVIGKPIVRRDSFMRKLGSFFIDRINKFIFSKPPNLKMSSFRCLRRIVIETVLLNKTYYPVMGPILLKTVSRQRIVNVSYNHQKRDLGKSGYGLRKLVKTTFDNIINFSSLPLSVIGMMGFLSFLISMFFIIFFLIKKIFFGVAQTGWTSVVLFINFYSGIILFSIGVIGEYLLRILNESKNAPLYKEREVIKFEKEK